jgi:hypothetical protein
MLALAVVLAAKELYPIATFEAPVVFATKALEPTAVLLDAVVLAPEGLELHYSASIKLHRFST